MVAFAFWRGVKLLSLNICTVYLLANENANRTIIIIVTHGPLAWREASMAIYVNWTIVAMPL